MEPTGTGGYGTSPPPIPCLATVAKIYRLHNMLGDLVWRHYLWPLLDCRFPSAVALVTGKINTLVKNNLTVFRET